MNFPCTNKKLRILSFFLCIGKWGKDGGTDSHRSSYIIFISSFLADDVVESFHCELQIKLFRFFFFLPHGG